MQKRYAIMNNEGMKNSKYIKTIIYLLIIICFCRCGYQNAESSGIEKDESENSVCDPLGYMVDGSNPVIEDIDFSSEFWNRPPIQIPKGFVWDSILKQDKSRNLVISIFIPISNIEKIDNIVKSYIETEKKQFIEELDERLKEDNYRLSALPNDFDVTPISVYKDEKIISYSFAISYYHSPGVHGITMFRSFNFDAKNMQLIDFDNYFLVKSKIDTIFFTDIITRAINNDPIALHELYNLDFNVEKDTISFNFSHYEIASYAEGLIQARIPKKELYNKINPKYR